MNLTSLKNDSLILNLKNLVSEERKILSTIIDYLHEVNTRKLHLQMAYPTLFEFCVKELGYSASAAYRRIEAMKLIKNLPIADQTQIKKKIELGSLNLTHLTAAQNFFKTEYRRNTKMKK